MSWKNLLEDVINDNNSREYIAELNITTIANKMDMTYDFYIKHNMHAV